MYKYFYNPIFGMNLFKRPNVQNEQPGEGKARRFTRRNKQTKMERFYSNGVQLIAGNSKFLQLKNETIMLAINIFKNYLLKAHCFPEESLILVCICCVLLAAKFNEIFPPKLEEIVSVFEFLEDKLQIIKMEALILQKCNYEIPFISNPIVELEERPELQNEKSEKYMKAIYQCLCNPYFLNVSNQSVGKALLLMLKEKYFKRNVLVEKTQNL